MSAVCINVARHEKQSHSFQPIPALQGHTFRLYGSFLLLIGGLLMAGLSTAGTPQKLFDETRQICLDWQAQPQFDYQRSEPLEFRGQKAGTRFYIEAGNQGLVELEVIGNPQIPNRFIAVQLDSQASPRMLFAFNGICEFQVGRQIVYDQAGKPLSIIDLDEDLAVRGEPEWLNPPWPARAGHLSTDATRLRVGLVDSGVNYLLPEISQHLAVDGDGQLIGYDFWDMDAQPFDAHPGRSLFFVQRHGTKTASILLREAPGIELVPYRYPRPDMTRMRALVEHAQAHDVRILGMPLGGKQPSEWRSFAEVAAEHPDLLFIASAGNDGFDIDQQPVFPAALDLDNLLVVTSSDDFVRPAERSNWGRIFVDYMLPAENVQALDFGGSPTRASGSSYAVSRLVAMAARMLQKNPDWNAGDIIDEFENRYRTVAPRAKRWVSSGFIPDPLADGVLQYNETLQRLALDSRRDFGLSLDLLILDERWSPTVVRRAVEQAFDILGQCGIGPLQGIVRRLEVDDYLRDLSIGNAHRLFSAIPGGGVRVVFARDTVMQEPYTGEAFGIGNTSTRPWMTNSVWLVLEVDDPGVALAHELFHVLANNGSHISLSGNLMQGRTRPDGIELSIEQCLQAMQTGRENGLLIGQES